MKPSSRKLPPLLVIVGPTASGKSDLAMQLAQQYDGEIICADSRTVYRGMDIGTAKPSLVDQALVPHHLLDLVDPGQPFTVADFQMQAQQAIADIHARGALPLLVGGSGLYINSLIYDYKFGQTADTHYRDELDQHGLAQLQVMAHNAKITHLNASDFANKRRIIRALELNKNNKKILNKSNILRENTLVLGLSLNKDIVQKRITQRVELILNKGLIEEVRNIGLTFGWESEAMTGICYQAFKTVAFNNDKNPENIQKAAADFIAGDIKLVKKQLTWFRRNLDIVWLNANDQNTLLDAGSAKVGQWLG